MRTPSALLPIPVRIATDAAGRPSRVDDRAVLAIREEWRVEDGWWAQPVRRRYFEVILDGGVRSDIFEDRRRPGVWMRQGG